MYRLLIVDDEEIEREGMAQFIDWAQYDVELAGTAWNGVEGLEKIQSLKPDIVLTDIKMPVMDGIELIRRAKKERLDVEFVVLSGYGEFEFTSQAMEQGVRHYLLKPCDEEQIITVLDKVKQELDMRRMQAQRTKDYESTMHRMLPRAKEQVFRDMLLEQKGNQIDYELFLKEYGSVDTMWVVLAFQKKDGFDYLEKFILENILTELLGEEHVYLNTSIQKFVFFLADAPSIPKIRIALERLEVEFRKIVPEPLLAALSDPGMLEDVSSMYGQVQQLLKIGTAEGQTGLLHYGLFREMRDSTSYLVDYEKIRDTGDYGDLLFEIYFTFMKMELETYTLQQKEEVSDWIMKVMYGVQLTWKYETDTEKEQTWELLEQTVEGIAKQKEIDLGKGKEAQRIKQILLSVFYYINRQELNIQFLAHEVLFMNEDYFSRIFLKNRKERFSAYLLAQRIHLARRLFQYNQELKISQVAELVGYSSDGQYFSKAFRKITGISPTEYRDSLKRGEEKR